MKTSHNSQFLRLIAIGASLAALVLALVGFGSALASPTATASKAKAAGVRIQGFSFHAATTRVKRGTRITFTNKDGVAHTATGRGFNTGTISPGHSKAITFSKKGTFMYHCSIHPDMHGKVIVE
jgi:plastocyanin